MTVDVLEICSLLESVEDPKRTYLILHNYRILLLRDKSDIDAQYLSYKSSEAKVARLLSVANTLPEDSIRYEADRVNAVNQCQLLAIQKSQNSAVLEKVDSMILNLETNFNYVYETLFSESLGMLEKVGVTKYLSLEHSENKQYEHSRSS